MKIKQIVLAVATTLLAGQAFAAAVSGADIATARAANNLQETWLSGASAPTYNVFLGYAKDCDAGSVSLWTDGTKNAKPGSVGNNMAYACTRGGVVSVVYHTVEGGSFNAYAPHVVGATLTRLKKLESNTTCAATTAVVTAVGTVPQYNKCTIVTPATSPDDVVDLPAGGFSDVEAALFGFDVTAAGTEAEAYVGQVFGVAVNPVLYRALQAAQSLSDVDANTFDPANAPNITSAQYTSIISSGGNYHTNWSPLIAGSTKAINLVRRVDTSGTQASSNAFFLKNPCNGQPGLGGALAPAAKATDENPGVFNITEGSGTGDVKKKLTALNVTNDYGIGIISLENNPATEKTLAQAGDSYGYRFIKLDGVHPEAGDTTNARAKAVSGEYPFHMEMRSFLANTADSFGAALIPAIAASLGNPADCTTVPRGLTLNPNGGSSCTVGVQVAKHTRYGNNCQATQF